MSCFLQENSCAVIHNNLMNTWKVNCKASFPCFKVFRIEVVFTMKSIILHLDTKNAA